MSLMDNNIKIESKSDQRHKILRKREDDLLNDMSTRDFYHLLSTTGDDLQEVSSTVVKQKRNEVRVKNDVTSKRSMKRRKRARKHEQTQSPTESDDSLPFLNRIRFDDNIVTVTDPETSIQNRSGSEHIGGTGIVHEEENLGDSKLVF
ncbi:hypothetical protein DICVIV_13204 [Dictyocaulus viviparus]|uniref:Uncharacterized protein n=1 Tax=Dictyocaulus viviparus TaxID=29172 RepID=A0A0D8XB11_DICVI|nr:hypothetical protein DICVIV_13204 [Dictyocaulus viviparus]